MCGGGGDLRGQNCRQAVNPALLDDTISEGQADRTTSHTNLTPPNREILLKKSAVPRHLFIVYVYSKQHLNIKLY